MFPAKYNPNDLIQILLTRLIFLRMKLVFNFTFEQVNWIFCGFLLTRTFGTLNLNKKPSYNLLKVKFKVHLEFKKAFFRNLELVFELKMRI